MQINRFRALWAIFFFILLIPLAYSQVDEVRDSMVTEKISTEKDSQFEESLERYRDKSKFNRLIHRLFVKKPGTPKAYTTSDRFGETHENFSEFEGKVIRDIQIETYDPFGYSLSDSTLRPDNFLEKAGNFLHIKTKEFVIKNYLLPERNQTIDSLKILESERLIRSQKFIRRVKITPIAVGNDSVDLEVKTLDSWSTIPNLTYSGSRLGFRLRDRNFLGFGHDFDNRYRQNFETGRNTFQTRYSIPNIQRSFIGFNIGYYSNEENDFSKSVSLERKFFSPLARWAGGVYIGQRAYQDSIPNQEGILAQNFKFNLQDYWGAVSFQLFKKENSMAERVNNLILSARYFQVNYVKKPVPELDPSRFYSNEDFYLMGIGISRRGFVQDRYIQNYDIVEDIPIGLSYGLTAGIQNKNKKNRFYLSGGFKMGNYYRVGFFGFETQYGGFFGEDRAEQVVFSFDTHYFTRLMSWGRWKFRNFISTELVIGNNRMGSRGDRLTLNEHDPSGIPGFYSRDVIGTKKWLTNIQIQSYSPYEFLGFRFSPFLNSSLGLISNKGEKLFNGKLYAKIGLGVLFTNDYLVFSNFQLSIAWYNTIPGSGDNIIQTNTFDNRDYELMDFEFGKPELIRYNPYVVY